MKTSILIIDDEEDLLVLLKKHLTQEGYSITTCNNGKSGIAAYKKRRFDIVITDIRMPGMNGIEVIRTIEKMDDKVRFLIITGYSISGELTDLIETSKRVHGYVSKPFELEHLEERIKEALRLL